MAQRLAAATSPYLQQHADNPVDWYPWGEEALRRAAQEQKPILLSVGYSACHWCHVMAHESFEDPSIAKLMNALYVSIKVDREERPDLDKIYQLAHQLLTQRSGGWPLTLFLMPDTTPFFGGTYFPKEPRYGLPGFGELLQRVHDYYSQHGDELRAQNISLIETLHRIERLEPVAPEALSVLPLQKGAAQLRQQFDATHGGFGGAPKFPHPPSLERCLRDFAMTGDQAAFNIAVFSLNKMIRGGVYDQLGGGFYRYSVDAQWQIPHFEKMLYDNAQLLALCAEAAAASNSPLFDAALQETGDWVMREMQAPTGGYYSTLDADSEGHEGKFYAWSLDEVKAQFDARTFAIVAARFGLDGPPNFEGQWHLHVARDPAEIAKALNVSERRVIVALSGARQKLFEAREGRIRPGRDDKILTAWNGLMIKGMARAGRQLGRADFVSSAERALDYLRAELWRDGRLLATAREGRAHLNAYLDDHVFLIDGILALVEARWRDGDLEFAVTLAELVLDRFTDPETGALFMTSDDHERLILRTKPFSDDSTPAGNGIAARVFLQLGHLLGETRYLDAARRILTAGFKQMADSPMAFCTLLTALEEHFRPGETLVLRGDSEATKPWLDRLAAGYRPNRMVVAIPTAARSLPGVLAERTPRAEVTAYHCRGLACSAPITDLAALEALLPADA